VDKAAPLFLIIGRPALTQWPDVVCAFHYFSFIYRYTFNIYYAHTYHQIFVMPSPGLLLIQLLLLTIVVTWAPTRTSAQPCPALAVTVAKLRVRPAVGGWAAKGVPTVRAGGLVKVVVTLSNTGDTKLRHATLRLQLPDYIVPKKASLWPRLKRFARHPVVEDARVLYWKGLTLAPGEIRNVRISAFVPHCQNTTASTSALAVQASAYLVADDDVTCLTEARPSIFHVRRILKGKSSLALGPCTPLSPPIPIPDDAGYSVFANNQICQNAVLTNLSLRRLNVTRKATTTTRIGGGSDEGPQPDGRTTVALDHRALSSITNPTVEECKAYTCMGASQQ
jgi:hypothetical protein